MDVRFFLKPEELDEAAAVRNVKSNQKSHEAIMRTGRGYAAFFPYIKGACWSIWWYQRPEAFVFWGELLILDIYIVLG